MLKISLLSSLLAFSILFQACSSQKNEHKEKVITKESSQVAKNKIILKGIDNKKYVLKKSSDGFQLENSKAKILILDVFATWCPPCQAEAPHLASLQKKYRNDIKVIGVSIEDNIPNEKLKAFRDAHAANYVLVNSKENRKIVDDIADKLKLGRNFGIPLLVIYKDGKLIHFYQGAIEEEFIESDIKRALEI